MKTKSFKKRELEIRETRKSPYAGMTQGELRDIGKAMKGTISERARKITSIGTGW